MDNKRYAEHLVFGLDIGTRSIVGTVGYKDSNQKFIVVAQCIKEHETRAMMDGQIHDIFKVAETIQEIKNELEAQLDRKLTDVCIAAAGRVLKTITTVAEYDFQSETTVIEEHIHSLELIGVEKAYETLRNELKEDKIGFYCVGYSVVQYYLNGYEIAKLEGHKAKKIGTKLLATFLPDEVIDGLYSAVEHAGLRVSNLTLEPIAAINVAIPEKFRLLNIAMIDVGAGTSDISITKDGSISAYGMIPRAGDEMTENILKNYLVEFKTAEAMKLACLKKKKITYKDIMGISHKITTEEIIETVGPTIHSITKCIADEIIKLNGKSVSAVFVVGGGGKIPGFTKNLATYLDLPEDRVALRGEEVLGDVTFLQENIKKDPLLVTPIGICLNFYDQSNNFIFVNVNNERIKLYDNNKLSIVDAAIQMGLPYEELFPKRGSAISFSVNGDKRMVRGELGEAAVVKLNGDTVGLSQSIKQNDKIEIIPSTMGGHAFQTVGKLPEYKSNISFSFNGQNVICPKFVEVNNELVSEFYELRDGDEVTILNYYTLLQVLKFMDVKYRGEVFVNNVAANLEEKIYDNFSIQCRLISDGGTDEEEEESYLSAASSYEDCDNFTKKELSYDDGVQRQEHALHISNSITGPNQVNLSATGTVVNLGLGNNEIYVSINREPIALKGKANYILVDIFDFYPFDLSKAKGQELIITLNGEKAEFTLPLNDKDIIELYWK
ncbi:MAG: cell division protein FtsA [Anaerocolumna sp.]|jgi:cell division protein FtsA|nr:cell division protein FtsA [Anaerocolumna sp.]